MRRLEEKPGMLVLFGGLGFLTLFAMGAILYFLYVAAMTAHSMVTLPAHISFDKGAFYLLGAGIGLSAIIVAGIYESGFRKTLTKEISGVITKVALGGLLIMFVVPHLAHFWVDNVLEEEGYQMCREASHRWLHSRTIVYVKNSSLCLQLIEEEEG